MQEDEIFYTVRNKYGSNCLEFKLKCIGLFSVLQTNKFY